MSSGDYGPVAEFVFEGKPVVHSYQNGRQTFRLGMGDTTPTRRHDADTGDVFLSGKHIFEALSPDAVGMLYGAERVRVSVTVEEVGKWLV